MQETELKFLIDRTVADSLQQAPHGNGCIQGEARTLRLRSVYHDTADRALGAAGIALRMRHDGQAWIQTVKAARTHRAGLSEARESEVPLHGPLPDIAAIGEEDLAGEVARLIGGAPLSPVFETEMTRTVRRLELPNLGIVELAVDTGEIRANGSAAPLREAEFELVSGSPRAVFAAARCLLPAEGAIRLSSRSKAERAVLLAETGSIHPAPLPRQARSVVLASGQTSEQAAHEILSECLDQIAANVAVCLDSDAPEGPHQLRVGLRRLRSAIQIFGAVLEGPALAALATEARWLGHEVGALRDLDVALAEIIAPELAEPDPDPGLACLAQALETRARAVRSTLRGVLAGPRVRGFLLDLGEFLAARLWLDPADYGQTARLARPVIETAGQALDARLAKAESRAAGIAHLDIEARHDLRKTLKSLRYAAEFLSGLYPEKKVKPFLQRLKTLQTVFGDLNDASMAQALFRDLPGLAAGDLAAARAAGYLTGIRMERARRSWTEARADWKALRQTSPFWR